MQQFNFLPNIINSDWLIGLLISLTGENNFIDIREIAIIPNEIKLSIFIYFAINSKNSNDKHEHIRQLIYLSK